MTSQSGTRPQHQPAPLPTADVCLIVEGCYPYVSGGVSSWLDWLMRTQPELTFTVVSIVTGAEHRAERYAAPANRIALQDLVLHETHTRPPRLRWRRWPSEPARLAATLSRFIAGGGLDEFRELVGIINAKPRQLSLDDLLNSSEALDVIRGMYQSLLPNASFLQYYWAWRALCGGLFATLKFPLPPARAYHAISTGYAGLLAARAAIETGRPALVTEHGIYTNERRIEILMAEWISDTIDKGVSLDDPRMDLRDLWIAAFESYARACYAACSRITTLYRDNQELQIPYGAAQARLQVIANGIDVEQFGKLEVADHEARPTIALIGRVVPIKDVRTFIAAAAAAHRLVPELRALVMGPTDEDAHYYEECRQLVADLDLGGCVEFTGAVRITHWMSSIHVVVLSSLSEAQPLVLLEAGAAGIPCVATNVGACREIIEGAGGPDDPYEPGGFVTDLVAPDQIANCVVSLLRNAALRRRMGEALRRRVRRHYDTETARARYAGLYASLIDAPARDPSGEAV